MLCCFSIASQPLSSKHAPTHRERAMSAADVDDFKPTGALDIVTVVLIATGGAAMLIGNIVILWNRNYRPIKTKSVSLTFLSSVGGLIWIVAALVVNHHFARPRHSALSICPLWTYWMQACFGFSLWLNCLTLHLIRLYRIFIYKRPTQLFDYVILIVLLMPAIILCIVATAKHQLHFECGKDDKDCESHKNSHLADDGDCKFSNSSPWAYLLIALLVIYFLIFLGFAFKLRNTMSPLNEFRLIRRGGVLSLFLFLLSLVTLSTKAYDEPVGRCLLSAAMASAIFYYFWARNGVVLYNVLFHKSEYLQMFNAEFSRSPSQHERGNLSDAALNRVDHLFEIQEKVENYKQIIKQLEDEVRELEHKHSAMR